jgi:2-C-methyl-D-erythritol 4-phosphate cytidylyltransferase
LKTYLKNKKVVAVIVAAGDSQRMAGIDKVFAPLGGEPVLIRATRPFQQCSLISQIIVVVAGDKERRCRSLVTGPEWSKVTEVCLGGKRRQDSVAAGLKLIKDCDWVVIHDGARPLVTVDLIERGLEAAQETGAAVAAVPVTDTIKTVDDAGMVRETPQRRNLRAVQTPQVFRFDIIVEAYRRASEDVTDDASLVERLGYQVRLYPGSYDNIKVTTPDDLALAEAILKKLEK